MLCFVTISLLFQLRAAIASVVRKEKVWKIKPFKSSASNTSILQEVIIHTILTVLANRTSRLMVIFAKLLLSPQDVKVIVNIELSVLQFVVLLLTYVPVSLFQMVLKIAFAVVT